MVRISVELPDEVAEGFARLAQDRTSTPEALLSRWAAEAVEARRDLEAGAAEALDDLAAGRTVDHEDVIAELDAWAADLEARHGKRR